jgi:hypothetical protein
VRAVAPNYDSLLSLADGTLVDYSRLQAISKTTGSLMPSLARTPTKPKPSGIRGLWEAAG